MFFCVYFVHLRRPLLAFLRAPSADTKLVFAHTAAIYSRSLITVVSIVTSPIVSECTLSPLAPASRICAAVQRRTELTTHVPHTRDDYSAHS